MLSEQQRNELETINAMRSVQQRYFPELQNVVFDVVYDKLFDGVSGQAIFGGIPRVVLHYSEPRIISPNYRMGLIPVIAHELAHYIDPANPERIMHNRLPIPMMTLWEEFLKAGYAKCSSSTELPVAR